ncbi:Hypothetical predicted protein [Olea europaea subsp. europaea]|uniref:DUF1985 domain-containing protein n=1 Tax=Olea europaea subsp. europaea TaxID=158383 RepID=A0A8S0VMH3_OLEEU|nr:Hypothetical predicted protein [Olea europaea subsp. europaea]
MEFKFRISKDARLWVHISQRSNLKYVKTVMDHFDERQWEDFHNSSLGYLAKVSDIQFSTQLIQQLVFRTVHTDKVYELWFNMQGHFMRFGVQEYALVTGLRCSAFLKGGEFDRLLERRRLKERCFKSNDKILLAQLWSALARPSTVRVDRYKLGLVLIVEGVFNALDIMSVWAYEVLLEVGERFAHSGDGQLVREDSDDEGSKEESGAKQTSGGDHEDEWSGSDHDGEDTGDSHSDRSSASKDTRGGDRGAFSSPRLSRVSSPEQPSTTQARAVGTSTPGLARGNVEELLLDQRILFEMRLCTVKFEIQQHVTSECRSLQEFIAALMVPAGPTTAAVEIEVDVSGSLPEDVYEGHVEPCPDEQDMLVDTGTPQDRAHIAPCEDDVIKPMATASEEMQDVGTMEPSNVAQDDDEEAEGCDTTDGDGVVIEVLLPLYPTHGPEFLLRDGARYGCDIQLLLLGLRIRGEGEKNKEVIVTALPREHDDGLVLVFAL